MVVSSFSSCFSDPDSRASSVVTVEIEMKKSLDS